MTRENDKTIYTVRREPFTEADLKTCRKIDKLIRRAVNETWLMEAQKVMEEQDGGQL
jgi:hypothetical protein